MPKKKQTSSAAPYDALTPECLLDAVDATVREVVKKLGKRKDDVRSIGVSGQQHGFVALDKKNKPIRPAKLWCDTSTTEQCAQFEAEFGGADELIKLAGNAMLPGYTEGLDAAALQGRVAWRATTPDRLPLLGEFTGAPGLPFCSGADISEFSTVRATSEAGAPMRRPMSRPSTPSPPAPSRRCGLASGFLPIRASSRA